LCIERPNALDRAVRQTLPELGLGAQRADRRSAVLAPAIGRMLADAAISDRLQRDPCAANRQRHESLDPPPGEASMPEREGREPPGARFEEGLRVRGEVLRAAHVQRALEQASEFSRPIQELVTEYCWGASWARPGLVRRDRSLINLGMLTALGRSHELGVHVRGAIANGCTKREIQEALLQATICCGVPAGMEAFRVAESVIDELEAAGVAVADGAEDGGPGNARGGAGGGDPHDASPDQPGGPS
jgi:4-carboxymuconolactone decarboxylase